MSFTVETLGNAIVQLCEDGRPILTTDPWFEGTAYFGSWALERPLTPEQRKRAHESAFLWISHGHPDHLHHESLANLPRGKTILLPDHYHPEICDTLAADGFDVRVMAYKKWMKLTDKVEVMCLDNWNQDAALVIRAGDALLINLNDSPLFGEGSFLRGLVRRHPNKKTYLFALCAIDADMINFVNAKDERVNGDPEERKPGAVWTVARMAEYLGVSTYCISSSQHQYVRADSVWANLYRLSWDDVAKHWSRPSIKLVQPYVTIDLATGQMTPTPAPPRAQDDAAISPGDDWSELLSEDEWQTVERFFRRFETVRDKIDFVAVTVGGETRDFALNERARGKPRGQLRGFRFSVPKRSLMECVAYGYFDDLLIGNFMKTELINTSLYPNFSPLVAKLGGNAKVFTAADYRRFWWRYFKRSPIVMTRYFLSQGFDDQLVPAARAAADRLGVKPPLKRIYRRLLGDPI
jgi:hypothetical protein